MNSWNELDGSTFFNKIFTTPVAIGSIELFTINIDNSRPTIILEFDITEYPDTPPEKWKKSGFNTCRIGLNCGNISNLTIKNVPTNKKLNIKITQNGNSFTIHASNNDSLIEFTTKSPLLCGPSAYINNSDHKSV
ncbi:Imm50 family immunity protein [Pseudomonas sp. MWU13-2100]|uniref:Imm50 family immunity protein n=1 Tax=Pseudomonas sp. MWU13-2100 TaxID=2935075 RepID=UPI0020108DB1|nr:Imm50 family immunity protein [Pseudomonas sp. MWU13-2100]